MLLSSPLSLRVNFSWTLVGNVTYSGCQWGILVILAKLGSPEMVGQFALGLAITAPIIMFTNLCLRNVQTTDANREYLFGDYFALRIIMTLLAMGLIIGIAVLGKYHLETALTIIVIGLSKSIESISDVFYGLLQQHERMDRIAKSMMLKGPLSLLAMGSGVYFFGSVLWGGVGLVIAWTLCLLMYDVPSGMIIMQMRNAKDKHLQPRWIAPTLVRLAWLTLPLGLVMMLISLNVSIPRYFIQHYLGERELGIFAPMAYLMVAGTTVIYALGEAASPRLAKYYSVGQKPLFLKLLLKLLALGLILGGVGIALAIVAGRYILVLLYTAEYAEHVDAFIWLAGATAIGYLSSFLGYGITATRQFSVQIPLNIVLCLITLSGSVLLIPYHGIKGAVWGILCSILVQIPLKAWILYPKIFVRP